MTLGGGAAGKFEVKSCGKAHAWCGKCRPEQAAKQRKKPPAPKVHAKPCRNCGMCNACIGLDAPEGMKVCRKCRETRPIENFPIRNKKGARRNHCTTCITATAVSAPCADCGKTFWRTTEHRTLCPRCRPPLSKPCAHCGAEFTGSMEHRRYCSDACRKAAQAAQIAEVQRKRRHAALMAYSTTAEPSCSCCGVTGDFFLALDHINGGGGKHRKETGGGGFYFWLKRHGYPEGFRILCHNCNFGRQLNGGVCPHQEPAGGQ